MGPAVAFGFVLVIIVLGSTCLLELGIALEAPATGFFCSSLTLGL
jgi:hypothetical protein